MSIFLLLTALVLPCSLALRNEYDALANRAKPNFVFIMTDDQDAQLDSMDYLKSIKKYLVNEGTTFKKHFCTVSLCCPSRVSLLTGKAAHNTNVTDVQPPFGGYTKFITEGLNDAYLPIWLQAAGYNTYYTGKLMNYHNTETYNNPRANGWNRSDFLIDPGTYRYLNGLMTLDHEPYRSIKGQYSTDIVANRSLEFLHNAIAAGQPFFLGVTPIGPHSNLDVTANGPNFTLPIPADRHKDLFPDVKIPRNLNFNPDIPGPVSYLKTLPKLNSTQVHYLDDYYRARLQALQAVDDLVAGLVSTLEQNPSVLENTYIIFTSDNGFHLGQHRLPPGKTCNIEEDINIPFVIRGPGIKSGESVSFPTSHTDIVPTIFDLAGIPLHDDFDGIPMAVTTKSRKSRTVKNENVNIEFWGDGVLESDQFLYLSDQLTNNTYKTLRVISEDYDFMYAVWCTNEHQLYNMKSDPHQMDNLYESTGQTSGFDIPSLSSRLDGLLLSLKACKGKTCQKPWSTLFPQGNVNCLVDAMNPKYDDFFSNQKRVSFSQCALGYFPKYEGAMLPTAFSGRF